MREVTSFTPKECYARARNHDTVLLPKKTRVIRGYPSRRTQRIKCDVLRARSELLISELTAVNRQSLSSARPAKAVQKLNVTGTMSTTFPMRTLLQLLIVSYATR
jgi:hypothetical protein